ncbi:MAG: hypothetical protein QOF69_1385 [Solirubrobacteraceae bacterium]|jgi:hypothetical protein|nr:hypothetical protein [Solirubrobacteraceae bacterium]
MSEKRHRQQQRRQRRKAAARPGSNHPGRPAGGDDVDRELAKLLADMAAMTAREAHEAADALEAEQWASTIIGTWHARPMPGQNVEAMFFPGYVDALARLGTAAALASLRALAAAGADPHGRRASAAADRLAARGHAEPPWSIELGHVQPTAAALMSEEAFDDGVQAEVQRFIERYTDGLAA